MASTSLVGCLDDVTNTLAREAKAVEDRIGELARLRSELRLMQEQMDATVDEWLLIDGVDPFADPNAPVGLSCRVYTTDTGYRGSPTLEQV